MAKNEQITLDEGKIRNIVKASIRESLLKKMAMKRETSINEAVSSVLKEMVGEPEQVANGVYITDIQFGPDADGTVSLSFDATEENPDGDAFQTEFTLDQYRLDAMMHSEHPGDNLYMGYPEDEEQLASCVRLYQGVSYDPAVSQAIKIAIIKHYLEEQSQSPMNEDTKRQRQKDPMNQWFKDMDDAQKVRDTMEYIHKGGRNPNKKEETNESVYEHTNGNEVGSPYRRYRGQAQGDVSMLENDLNKIYARYRYKFGLSDEEIRNTFAKYTNYTRI